MLTNRADELKQFDHSRVEKIVPVTVGNKTLDNGSEEIALDDVTIVEVILEANDLAHQS